MVSSRRVVLVVVLFLYILVSVALRGAVFHTMTAYQCCFPLVSLQAVIFAHGDPIVGKNACQSQMASFAKEVLG